MNGNGVPMPVAAHSRNSSGAYPGQGREYGGVGNNGGMGGLMGARSPPKSKSEHTEATKEDDRRICAEYIRYLACSVQVLPIRPMSGRRCLSVLARS